MYVPELVQGSVSAFLASSGLVSLADESRPDSSLILVKVHKGSTVTVKQCRSLQSVV